MLKDPNVKELNESELNRRFCKAEALPNGKAADAGGNRKPAAIDLCVVEDGVELSKGTKSHSRMFANSAFCLAGRFGGGVRSACKADDYGWAYRRWA